LRRDCCSLQARLTDDVTKWVKDWNLKDRFIWNMEILQIIRYLSRNLKHAKGNAASLKICAINSGDILTCARYHFVRNPHFKLVTWRELLQVYLSLKYFFQKCYFEFILVTSKFITEQGTFHFCPVTLVHYVMKHTLTSVPSRWSIM
jgi:hypothetical protein